MNSNSAKRIAYIGVAALAAVALGRAASLRFQAKEEAIRDACQADLRKLGLRRDAVKSKYPTPEIHMVSSGCLLPGGTGEIVVKGKFVPNTKFVFENDNVEVVKEALLGNEYRAVVKIAPGIPPQNAPVVAISPVTGVSAQDDGVAIGGKVEWNLQAANGWRIIARSPANKTCGGPPAEDSYNIEFVRKGEAAPFQKALATASYDVYEGATNFTINLQDGAPEALSQELETLGKRMADPNVSDAEREKVTRQVEKLTEKLQAAAEKMSDPEYARQVEEQRQKFGCNQMDAKVQAGNVTGELRCSENVGAQIPITGSLKFLGR